MHDSPVRDLLSRGDEGIGRHQRPGDVEGHGLRDGRYIEAAARPDRLDDAGIVDQDRGLRIGEEIGEGSPFELGARRFGIGEIERDFLQMRRKTLG